MKELHPDLAAHLQEPATTVCLVWVVARSDGVRLGFTDHDRPMTVDGVDCRPATGFTAGAAEASLGLSGDMSDVTGVLSSDDISDVDIERGLYDAASVSLYLVNWTAPETASLIRRHHIGEITRQGGAFRVELRSLSVALDQPKGRYFTRGCDAELGDGRCGVDLSGAGLNAAGTVHDIVDARTLDIAGVPNFAERWYDFGSLRFDDGVRTGDRLSVATAVRLPGTSTTRIVLRAALGAEPAAGDAVTLFAGCDKAFGTCKTKFDNHLNFRGFPHMPGDDRALGYVNGEGEFDGGPLVR